MRKMFKIINAHSCQIIYCYVQIKKTFGSIYLLALIWLNGQDDMDFKVILLTNQDLKTIFYEKTQFFKPVADSI